ncbi:MAG: type II secretion system protein [Desulfobacteraceae bacterium]|nr:type II secretion system protein [Desulfobacteraceae bacterium]
MCRRRDNILNCQGGFTLVELLVVIAIIVLLMSILMPSLARARKQAQGVVCQQNLHVWGIAFQLFADEHDGYFMKSDTTVTGKSEDYSLHHIVKK